MSGPDVATVAEMFSELYDIVEPMPWSGLALTYKALVGDEAVVVALLPIDAEGSPEAAAMFEAHAEALVGLDHPRLLSANAQGIRHGVPYLELPYVEGETLDRLVAEGPLDRQRALTIARRILRALEVLEADGVLHLDLTPSNILVTGVDDVRVMGAGVAAILREVRDTEETGPTGRGSGPSPGRYLAPELLIGDAVDTRSDLYSVGVLLHLMLTGAPIGKGGPPAPADLAPIIARATEKSRVARYPRAFAMRAAIEATGAPVSVMPPPLPPSTVPPPNLGAPALTEPASPRQLSSRAVIVALSAVALVAAIGIGVGLTSNANGERGTSTTTAVSAPAPGTTASASIEPVAEPEPDLTPEVEAEPAPEVGTEPAPEIETEPARPEPPSRVDLLAGDLPEPLDAIWSRVAAGEEPPLSERHLVTRYISANRDDARPHLLLARDYMARRWSSDAISEYLAAFAADPESRADTRMRDELLELSMRERSGPAAGRAVARIYGSEALPYVEAMLEADLEARERRRVEQLKRRLSGS